MNEKTVTNKKRIAENTTIGKSIQDKMYPTKKYYSQYLKNLNPNTFFIKPTSPKEIIDITQNIKTAKMHWSK